jgi:hypothetical protein
MNEQKADLSKLSDYEISMLLIERNSCEYKAKQITELLNKIGESKGVSENASTNQRDKNKTLESSDLGRLPWKSYRTKENAAPEEAAWVFSNTFGTQALLTTLKNSNGKLKIGSFEYQLQGRDGQFIARKPLN